MKFDWTMCQLLCFEYQGKGIDIFRRYCENTTSATIVLKRKRIILRSALYTFADFSAKSDLTVN